MNEQVLRDEAFSECVMAAHCVRVLGYAVDYEACELRITTDQQGKRLVLRFEELLAHHFDHTGRRNVIYDVSAISPDAFITAERRQLTRTLRYGFPLGEGKDTEALRAYLSAHSYSVYQIRASVGMCGYVIAKRLVIEGVE